MKGLPLLALFFLSISSASANAQAIADINPMVQHPEWYINLSDWAFYAAFKAAIIHHVTIENTSDIPYRDIKVLVRYYSTAPTTYGTQIGQEIGVLPVRVPPHSKDTYLKSGSVLGSGSSLFYAGDLEVLGAVPMLE